MKYRFIKPDLLTKKLYSVSFIFLVIGILGWYQFIPLSNEASLIYLLISALFFTLSAAINIYKNIKQLLDKTNQ